jgi:hypothetical protein
MFRGQPPFGVRATGNKLFKTRFDLPPQQDPARVSKAAAAQLRRESVARQLVRHKYFMRF